MLGAWPVVEPSHKVALDLSLLCLGEATPEILPHDGFCRLIQIEGHLHPRHHLRVPDRLFHPLILPDLFASIGGRVVLAARGDFAEEGMATAPFPMTPSLSARPAAILKNSEPF